MTKQEYQKMLSDLIDTEEVDELVKNCANSGMIRSTLYAFGLAIGNEVCDGKTHDMSKEEMTDLVASRLVDARDEALRGYNLDKFKEFIKKWFPETKLPSDMVLESTMREMVLGITTFTKDEKREALEWLTAHNSRPIDWSEDDK